MKDYKIIPLRRKPELKDTLAEWFNSKWSVPLEAYQNSMEECLHNQSAVPQWYAVMDGEKIIAGLGVIENDFHDRKDLTPNICAVYVEPEFRCLGIAGKMLSFVCEDMKNLGFSTLYLITNHTSFYERYGWEFLCMVQGDGEDEMIRMYIHREH